jgi:hypothetical protein
MSTARTRRRSRLLETHRQLEFAAHCQLAKQRSLLEVAQGELRNSIVRLDAERDEGARMLGRECTLNQLECAFAAERLAESLVESAKIAVTECQRGVETAEAAFSMARLKTKQWEKLVEASVAEDDAIEVKALQTGWDEHGLRQFEIAAAVTAEANDQAGTAEVLR